MTIDHVIAAVGGEGRGVGKNGERAALCFKDLGTGFVDMTPLHDRLATTTSGALDELYGDALRNHIYSDGAREFVRATQGLFIPHATSVLDVPSPTASLSERPEPGNLR